MRKIGKHQMHEMSIVAGVLDAVQASAVDAGAECVTKITLRIGDMTEVIDEALGRFEEVFKHVVKTSKCAD